MNKHQSGEALVTIVSTFEQQLREEGAVNGAKWCMEANEADVKMFWNEDVFYIQ